MTEPSTSKVLTPEELEGASIATERGKEAYKNGEAVTEEEHPLGRISPTISEDSRPGSPVRDNGYVRGIAEAAREAEVEDEDERVNESGSNTDDTQGPPENKKSGKGKKKVRTKEELKAKEKSRKKSGKPNTALKVVGTLVSGSLHDPKIEKQKKIEEAEKAEKAKSKKTTRK